MRPCFGPQCCHGKKAWEIFWLMLCFAIRQPGVEELPRAHCWAEERFPNCTVTFSGAQSPLCCYQASESSQKRDISSLSSHTYRKVLSCQNSLWEEMVNRSGNKQVGYSLQKQRCFYSGNIHRTRNFFFVNQLCHQVKLQFYYCLIWHVVQLLA